MAWIITKDVRAHSNEVGTGSFSNALLAVECDVTFKIRDAAGNVQIEGITDCDWSFDGETPEDFAKSAVPRSSIEYVAKTQRVLN